MYPFSPKLSTPHTLVILKWEVFGHKNTFPIYIITLLVHACSFASVVSNYVWPYGLWPTRLLCPWDSPGKNTGVVAITYSRESSQPRDRTWVSVSCIGRWILYQLCHLEVGRCFSSPFSKLSSKLLLWFIQSLYYLKFWTYLMKHSSKGKWFSPARLIQRKGVI